MEEPPRILTQSDLKDQGWSDYLIRQIVKNLDYKRIKDGLRLYKTSDIIVSIEHKLAKPKTRKPTRDRLQTTLAWLRGDSNIIEVDFLQNLSLEQKAEVLKARIEDADKNMEDSNMLDKYEELQKRVKAALADSKFSL
jgi:hypothetical protein